MQSNGIGTTVDRPSSNVDFNQGAYTFMGLRQLNEKVDLVFEPLGTSFRASSISRNRLFRVLSRNKQWVDPIVALS